MRLLAYLYQTRNIGLQYSGNHDSVGYVDSACEDDRGIFHSTSGYTSVLNRAAVFQEAENRGHQYSGS
jgi:hypothetical protein